MKNSKFPEKLKTLIFSEIKIHAHNLSVEHFNIKVLHHHKDEKANNDSVVCASMGIDRRYLTATLKVFPVCIEMWKEQGDDFIKKVIAHEVAHIQTQHMMDLVSSCFKDEGESKDAWESLTEVIGRLSIGIESFKKSKSK